MQKHFLRQRQPLALSWKIIDLCILGLRKTCPKFCDAPGWCLLLQLQLSQKETSAPKGTRNTTMTNSYSATFAQVSVKMPCSAMQLVEWSKTHRSSMIAGHSAWSMSSRCRCHQTLKTELCYWKVPGSTTVMVLRETLHCTCSQFTISTPAFYWEAWKPCIGAVLILELAIRKLKSELHNTSAMSWLQLVKSMAFDFDDMEALVKVVLHASIQAMIGQDRTMKLLHHV